MAVGYRVFWPRRSVPTLIWLLLAPFAHRDLASTPFLAWPTLAAFVYLLLYTFAVVLTAICHYNFSTKRWRGVCRCVRLSVALPNGCNHAWPRSCPVGILQCWMPLVAVIAWNVVELGLFAAREP